MNRVFRFFSCTTIAAVSVFLTPSLNADILGFQSDYAPANWTSTPGTGSIDTTGAPTSIALTSGDNGSSLPSNTDFTFTMLLPGTVNFRWDYVSSDLFGAAFDEFWYLVNGTPTKLTDPGGLDTQSGSVMLLLSAGDVFGFRQDTFDNDFGSATTTITLFSGPGPAGSTAVPEPATASLLGFAILIGAFWQFFKRRQPAMSR